MSRRIFIEFFEGIIVSSLLALKVCRFYEEGIIQKRQKERPQREFLNPLGAFILDRSGKPIS
jgi:hypothetical protein